ncbi:MAG TPA: HAD family phosphatase [Flavisolibacter sp.]|nr:HAD family phosphatase [Flavisolibacter sp.]
MQTTEAIIFDLGGVLIDWNPSYLFDTLFDDETKKKHFFEHICTSSWNEEQDGGRSIKEGTELLVNRHPEWKEYIEAYYGRWDEMLGGPIHETVDIFRDLKQSGKYRLYALTNWSGELFPIALERYDFLHWFDGRVVSGDEKMRKPFPEFYQLTLNRFELQPERTLFIDDNPRNVTAAEDLGIQALRFVSPAQLRKDLEARGLI